MLAYVDLDEKVPNKMGIQANEPILPTEGFLGAYVSGGVSEKLIGLISNNLMFVSLVNGDLKFILTHPIEEIEIPTDPWLYEKIRESVVRFKSWYEEVGVLPLANYAAPPIGWIEGYLLCNAHGTIPKNKTAILTRRRIEALQLWGIDLENHRFAPSQKLFIKAVRVWINWNKELDGEMGMGGAF